jgi:hypothetical protein
MGLRSAGPEGMRGRFLKPHCGRRNYLDVKFQEVVHSI